MARWMLQLKELRELCDAVSLMCNISAEDHSKYVQRRVSKITNKQLCVSLIKHSHSFGVALNGIEEGAKYHNDLFCVPSICTIAQPNFSQQKTSWQKHILSDRQKMLELKETVDGTISSIDKAIQAFKIEDRTEYSSYSDYSDSETTETESDNEEPEGDEDDEDDEDDEGDEGDEDDEGPVDKEDRGGKGDRKEKREDVSYGRGRDGKRIKQGERGERSEKDNVVDHGVRGGREVKGTTRTIGFQNGR